MGFLGSKGCIVGGTAFAVALAFVIGGSIMIDAGTGNYAEIDLWYSVPLCPKDTPAETDYAPPPAGVVYVSNRQATSRGTLKCKYQTSADTVRFTVVPELFDEGKTYFPVAYVPNSVTFEEIDMTLTGLGSNTPMFSFKGKADSSSPTSRRLLKGSFGGGGGGTSSGSFGRGVSSGRATGVTSYRTGSGSERSVSYRSSSRSTYLFWGTSGGTSTSYGRRGKNIVKDDTVVFVYSPTAIGIRNDFDPTPSSPGCPANDTQGKYHYSSSGSSSLPTACTKAEEGCETVLLVDQDKLGFGKNTDTKKTGCGKPENECTNFVPKPNNKMYLDVSVSVRLNNKCPTDGKTAVWPHFFITFQTKDGTEPNGGLVGGGTALVVIGSICSFFSLCICMSLRNTSCDACEGCCKSGSGGQSRYAETELSGMAAMVARGDQPAMSSTLAPSAPGQPTVATDCPSGALPLHLLCGSAPYVDRNGDHTNLYDGLPSHITVLDLHSNDVTSLRGVERFQALGGLQIANNELTSFSGLANSQSLVWVDATSNSITSLSSCASNTLVWLNVMDNDIAALDPQSLPNLRCLLAGNNRITSIAPSMHSRMPSLAILDLNNNDLASIEGIQQLTSLMELDLQSNDIASADPLLELIPNCPNLRYLNVTDNNLKRGDVGRLQEALQAHLPNCTLVQDTIRSAAGGV